MSTESNLMCDTGNNRAPSGLTRQCALASAAEARLQVTE